MLASFFDCFFQHLPGTIIFPCASILIEIYRGSIKDNHLNSLFRIYGNSPYPNIGPRFARETSSSRFPLRFALCHDEFQCGMRIPFPTEVSVILDLLGINPFQLRPDSWGVFFF